METKQKIKDDRVRITFSVEIKKWINKEVKRLGLRSEADFVERIVIEARQQNLQSAQR